MNSCAGNLENASRENSRKRERSGGYRLSEGSSSEGGPHGFVCRGIPLPEKEKGGGMPIVCFGSKKGAPEKAKTFTSEEREKGRHGFANKKKGAEHLNC